MRGGAGRRLLAAAAAAVILGGTLLLIVVRAAYPLDYEDSIRRACVAHGLDPFLVISLIAAESGFRADAVSPAGAVGLMQIMPATGAWVAEQVGVADFTPVFLEEAETSVLLGTWYLSHLVAHYAGDLRLALAAYNAGPTAVDRWRAAGESTPATVASYVERVLSGAARYRFWYESPILGALVRALPR
ncbi:MAG: lytic transglycosylase domain-containing protein [Candidatus Bipolaricaulota bacterium]|nr:MAG: lytic transglycosylase domain-containing protein [Candidatus Bipolaricaulota bacterium]